MAKLETLCSMEGASVSKFSMLATFPCSFIHPKSFLEPPLPCICTPFSPVRSPFPPHHRSFSSGAGLFAKFSSLPAHQLKDPFPRALRHATLELASNNLICSVALTGVLALQAGRFWAESADDGEDDYVVVESEEQKEAQSRAKTPEAQEEQLVQS
jgi:hypothetical protein